MSGTHPPQVYTILRQLRDDATDEIYLNVWAKWRKDTTGTIEPPQREPGCETWVYYCLKNGLVKYEEWCSGLELTITEDGLIALSLHDQQSTATSNEKVVEFPSPQSAPTRSDTMPWEGNGDWARPTQLTGRILRFMFGRSQSTRDELIFTAWNRDDPGDNAIKAALHKTNKYLEEQGHHQVLEKVRDEPLVRWA